VTGPIPITSLILGKTTVMVDDPLHWYGMQDLAKASYGKVLVAGLGLGLIVHALEENNNVDSIDVVEINRDVISLVYPHIRVRKTRIIHDDFWQYLYRTEESYDTCIIDIWVYSDPKERVHTGYHMIAAVASVSERLPSAKVFIWGLRDPKWNPAVAKTPCYLETEIG